MADENWQKVREIFDVALRKKPEERAGFVNEACSGDKTLLGEVESLFSSLDRAEDFMETPAIAAVADRIWSENRRFSNGQILTHYEIIERLGAGGMGEVYLANDTKLNRRVALKILHPDLSSDNRANGRLLREAQAAAMLDHPNICQIHEISESDNESFIVMQYVEGETLADILAKSPGVEKSLELAIQIADALAEAHARRIIHRDIKPANIIVSEKNQAKVLDFGLAKFVEAESRENTANRLNSSGAVMGTVPYMSPEQLRGKRLDARTDIFSFGAMFYEMLCGRQAFVGESNAETISAILNDQPDLSKIPEKLRPIVRQCLMKNCDERYQTALALTGHLREAQRSGDFDESAQGVSTSPNEQVVTDAPPAEKRQFYFWNSCDKNINSAPDTAEIDDLQIVKSNRPLLIFLIALPVILIVSVSALIYWQFKKIAASNDFDALHAVLLVSWKSGASSNDTDYRVSHNGKMVAYSSTQSDGIENIFVKQTAEGKEIQVTGDEWRNLSPIWSPDDQRIAFVSVRENQPGIYVSPTLGGSATPFLITEKANISLRHWTKDGAAIFYEQVGVLYRLDLATRETLKITDFEDSPGNNDRYFSLSPDEKQIVFCDERDGQRDIWTMPTAGGESVRLTNDKDKELRPLWHADGERVLYNVERDNYTQINLVYADGRALPVQITRGEGIYELVDISPDGTKIYYTGFNKKSDIGSVNVETGEEFEAAAGIESELWADYSPDGKSIVYQSINSPNPTVFMHEAALVVKTADNQTRTVLQKGYNPRWLPDSRHIAFVRWNEAEQQDHLWLVSSVSGREKQLTADDIVTPSYGLMPIARGEISEFDFSPDGKRFVYIVSTKPRNIRLGSIDSAEIINLTSNENTNLHYLSPLFSADGKRIVFVSVEKPVDKAQKPIWRVWVLKDGKVKEIHFGTAGLRLVGWAASGSEIFIETTDSLMKSIPAAVNLVQISLSGESRTITTFKNIYIDSLTLAADGKMAAFTARRSDKDDIWTVSLTTGETRKITANGNTRLFYASPAFSPDGKTILFDKQDQINTISMFENFK